MAAMRMSPGIDYDPTWFALSVAIAIAASGAALWITYRLRQDAPRVALSRPLAAGVMGLAIVGTIAEILGARCESLKLEGPYVQLRPDLHGTDGFFAAVFERKKKGAGTDAAEAAEANLADEDDQIDAADGAEAEAQAGADAQTVTAEETAVEQAEVKASDVKETETAVKDPA